MIENLAGGNIWLVIAIKVGLVAAVFFPLISVVAMFSIWWERKVAGHIQSRVGPMHVGKWHGWAQTIADGVKRILKEDLIPRKADSFMFRLAPYLAFAPVFAAFIALPFGPQFVFEGGLNIGVLYILAVLAVEVMSTILAGWGSNSKWSIYGAMREACQMVSYEIPLGIAIIIGVIVAGTLNMVELGHLQAGGLMDWFIFHNPWIFTAFLIYFIASLASNKRAPFDLPESESELVAGYLTEYSGLRWSLFFLAEYNAMFVVGAIQAVLFLGAWHSPLGSWDPVYIMLGYDPVAAGKDYFAGNHPTELSFQLLAINLYGGAILFGKAMLTIFVQMWLRWTLPRIRIDQVLYCCVKVLLPASIALLLLTAAWIAVVPQPEHGLVAAGQPAVTTFELPAVADEAEIEGGEAAKDKATKQADQPREATIAVSVDELIGDAAADANYVEVAAVENRADLFATGDLYLAEPGPEGELRRGRRLRHGSAVKLNEAIDGQLTFVFVADAPGEDETPITAAAFQVTPAEGIARLGHLTQPTPGLQAFTQIVLAILGVIIVIACLAVMLPGWYGILFKGGRGQPPKTLFPDIMPVGRDVAYTSIPKPEPATE